MHKYIVLLCIFCIGLGRSPKAQTVGVITKTDEVDAGYTLFAPTINDFIYLIDECGQKINEWEANRNPGMIAKLDKEGNLFHAGRTNSPEFSGGGIGGILSCFDWNHNELFEINLAENDFHQHHDFEILPNGNILVLGWEHLSSDFMKSIGRETANNSGIWSEKVREIKPISDNEYEIVWEWRVIDHIIQDVDSGLSNYGKIEENPYKIDINYTNGQSPNTQDWLHCNSLDYNPDLDQIIVNCRNFGEFWIIDHSTTTEEAASSEGGITGMGGDILYRWGNPEAYNSGTQDDQIFHGQHDAHWIPDGFPGAGKIRVFNNGIGRPEGQYSTIESLDPPLVGFTYDKTPLMAFGPTDSEIIYGAPQGEEFFFSQRISGSQQLSNGNTLICNGTRGNFIEINQNKELVWDYINPSALGITTQGSPAPIGSNSVFQAIKYMPSFAGFQGKDLTPGEKIELDPIDNCTLVSTEDYPIENITVHYDYLTSEIVVRNANNLNISINVYDLQGKQIHHLANQHTSIIRSPFHSISAGIYLIQILSKNQLIQTIKIPVFNE